MKVVGWLLCIVCRCREAIFKICFLVKGAIKYGCCAHVVEIIQKVYLQWCYRPSVSNFTKNQNCFTRTPLHEKWQNMGFPWSVFSCIWTDSLILSKYRKKQIQFRRYTGKYGSEKAPVLAYFTHCFPVPNFYNGLTWKRNPKRHREISPTSCYYTPTVRNDNRKY